MIVGDYSENILFELITVITVSHGYSSYHTVVGTGHIEPFSSRDRSQARMGNLSKFNEKFIKISSFLKNVFIKIKSKVIKIQ